MANMGDGAGACAEGCAQYYIDERGNKSRDADQLVETLITEFAVHNLTFCNPTRY